ncbi:hypothetical protein BO94DRAFT_544056 [Aspergillus sclerotioniger CBS 115572]|uniref:Single-strand DNA deaminase toxin A-like C-terminal domain-containing protein n=1 Tax=Aspergillus sclerotioniger CBS 115572 TaxID=1450535 RepID=A0A317X372_9EURO|nr:hypothetical protein BO94DRAFT_544056 [Aspergillus sclerotioniger CBS 115572]PWY93006.1 hypothetical protein BO94DRAFT_544056 [Aspergillus sclerotioniger CBS 115572]
MSSSLSKADILWWNSRNFDVLCPHCKDIHRHDINWDGPKTRIQHCENQQEYVCCFPISDDGSAAYEIDKERARFVSTFALGYTGVVGVDTLADDFAASVNIGAHNGGDRAEHGPRINEDSHDMVKMKVGDDGEPFQQSPLNDHIFFPGPNADYPMTVPTNNVARLERGGKYPTVAAMSGWTHGSGPSPDALISGQQWTKEVFYIASVIGHELPPIEHYDGSQPGRYNACHAEKQLIAYFLDRHVFLPRDVEPDM